MHPKEGLGDRIKNIIDKVSHNFHIIFMGDLKSINLNFADRPTKCWD